MAHELLGKEQREQDGKGLRDGNKVGSNRSKKMLKAVSFFEISEKKRRRSEQELKFMNQIENQRIREIESVKTAGMKRKEEMNGKYGM